MSNQTKTTLDDIVFENRNKEYGAYFLRKNYNKYLTRATILGSAIFLFIFVGAYTYNNYILPNIAKDKSTEVDLTLSELDQKEEEPEELPELPPPPPPPPVEPPPEVAEIKFLPPEPKKDEEVKIEEPPPPVEKVEKAVISNKNVEGVESPDAFVPPPPPKEVEVVKVEPPAKEDEIFTSVEQNPEFPGGTSALYKFLGENIKYPPAAQRASVQGKVFVKFVVEKDGSIGNVQVLKGVGFGCDEEAVRVIKSLPKWNPGRQNGKNVRVFYTMPVVYKLE